MEDRREQDETPLIRTVTGQLRCSGSSVSLVPSPHTPKEPRFPLLCSSNAATGLSVPTWFPIVRFCRIPDLHQTPIEDDAPISWRPGLLRARI